MERYQIVTIADREFDHDYYFVSVENTAYRGDNLVIYTAVDRANAPRYESMFQTDSAVISWKRITESVE